MFTVTPPLPCSDALHVSRAAEALAAAAIATSTPWAVIVGSVRSASSEGASQQNEALRAGSWHLKMGSAQFCFAVAIVRAEARGARPRENFQGERKTVKVRG